MLPTMYRESSVFFWVPLLILLPGAAFHNISCILSIHQYTSSFLKSIITHLWICSYLKPPTTQMALASEGINGGAMIVSNFSLLRIVPYTHSDVVVACPAVAWLEGRPCIANAASLPPDVKGEFEAGNQNPLVYFTSPVSEGVLPMIVIEGVVLLGIVIWWIVAIEALYWC